MGISVWRGNYAFWELLDNRYSAIRSSLSLSLINTNRHTHTHTQTIKYQKALCYPGYHSSSHPFSSSFPTTIFFFIYLQRTLMHFWHLKCSNNPASFFKPSTEVKGEVCVCVSVCVRRVKRLDEREKKGMVTKKRDKIDKTAWHQQTSQQAKAEPLTGSGTTRLIALWMSEKSILHI